MNKHKVDFYRYHRPLDRVTGFAKSSMGVTFYVRINYKRRWLRVSCSVCDGDNFSKLHGKLLARARYDERRWIEFSLDEYVASREPVLFYLRMNLDPGVVTGLSEFDAAAYQMDRVFAK